MGSWIYKDSCKWELKVMLGYNSGVRFRGSSDFSATKALWVTRLRSPLLVILVRVLGENPRTIILFAMVSKGMSSFRGWWCWFAAGWRIYEGSEALAAPGLQGGRHVPMKFIAAGHRLASSRCFLQWLFVPAWIVWSSNSQCTHITPNLYT